MSKGGVKAVRYEGQAIKKKYFLDFDPFDTDIFVLKTCDDHDIVYTGRFSEVTGDNPPDPWNVLDDLFMEKLGIEPTDWEIG